MTASLAQFVTRAKTVQEFKERILFLRERSGNAYEKKGLARISHQLFGIGFEGAESGDCGMTLSR